MNLKNELADKLKKEAEHFSGAQDLVEMLLDAEAMIRNLHTENTALRVTEDNLRQELKECQEQRRAAFRRIEELDAMRAQIGQGVPSQAASDAYDRIDHFLRQKLDDHDYAHYSFDLDLVWGAAPAPQQIGHGDPVGTAISYYTEDGHTKWTFQPTKLGWEMPQDSRANERGARSCFDVYTHPAPQQKPLTDEQQIAEALRKHGFALVKTATGYDVMKLSPCIAHNIGEKK